jgi:lipoprotein
MAKNFKKRSKISSKFYTSMMLLNLAFSIFTGCVSVILNSDFFVAFIFTFVMMAFMIARAADDEVYILRIPFKKKD